MTDTVHTDLRIAVTGPRTSWETSEAIEDFVNELRNVGVQTMILNEQGDDPRFVKLRDGITAGRVGGLAIIDFSSRYDEELDLSADSRVADAARVAVSGRIPIFVEVEPSMGGLDAAWQNGHPPEIIAFGQDVSVIARRLSAVSIGAA